MIVSTFSHFRKIADCFHYVPYDWLYKMYLPNQIARFKKMAARYNYRTQFGCYLVRNLKTKVKLERVFLCVSIRPAARMDTYGMIVTIDISLYRQYQPSSSKM